MTTVMQAVERLREHGTVPPSGVVRLRDLHQRIQPAPSDSVRALLLKNLWVCGDSASMGGHSLPV